VTFLLHARINRADAQTIRQALAELAARASITAEGDEFTIDAEVDGPSAKELNRRLLSALRKAHKRATLRTQWISPANVTESYFDYVLKKTIKG
jgi:hypothetical protein